MPLGIDRTKRRTTNKRPYAISVTNALSRAFTGPPIFSASLYGKVFNYRMSHSIMGGDWSAKFNLSGTEAQLKNFFLTKLGSHVEHKIGQQNAWEGYVYEMDLTTKGITRRMGMGTIRNRVKAKYTDENGDTQTTAWYDDIKSQRMYGKIEQIIWLEGVLQATAEATAQTYLKLAAFPEPEVINISETNETSLEVTCAGYAFSLNNLYVTAGNGTSQNVSTYIKDIVDTDAQYVTAGRIDTNTTQVKTSFNRDIRVWDALEELTETGNGTTPYTIQITSKRRLTYWDRPATPTILWQPNAVATRSGRNHLHGPYRIRPGIMRDQTWSKQGKVHSDSYLQSRSDTVISEVEVSDTSNMPLLKTEEYDDSDFMTALARKYKEENLIAPFTTKDRPFGSL